MKRQKRKSKRESQGIKATKLQVNAAPQKGVPEPEAFLAEAKAEEKRLLLIDHIETIKTLRYEKKFTFRAIASWLNQRGLDVDHSAVYRALVSSIPEQDRDPREDWSDAVPEET
jgi:hypothetical protein